jgi:alpha-beta hydrolase superfamily lysophospholipase
MNPCARSRGRLPLLILMLVAVLSVPAAAAAQTTLSGKTAGGAFYTVRVPEPWNGQLVIWNHGFDLSDPAPAPDLGPLAELQLSEGFAIAASSYRTAGWATFKVVKDLRALVNVVRGAVGEPTAVYLTGGSFGGLVSVQALEKGGVGNVAGVLALCAPLAGSRNWDAALERRLAYDLVCESVPSASLPGGSTGLPAGSDLSIGEITTAIDACTGIQSPPRRRSAAQKARLAQLLGYVGIDESFLVTDMLFATQALANLTHDRAKLRGRPGVGNAGVVYDDPELDAGIERVEARRGSARRLNRFYVPTGKLRGTPVLAMHTDKDDLVVVENLSEFAGLAPAEQLVNAVAVESVPSHCGFSPAESVAGWESLVVWAGGGARPTVEQLQASCRSLAALVGLEAICRFDPDFAIGDLDDRIPPRE